MPPLSPYTLQNGKSTTLSANILAAATTASLSSSAFTDFTSDYLVIDYDVPAKYEIVLCNVTGTSVTSMTRGQLGTSAVDHGSGAKVAYSFVSKHYDDLTTGIGLASKMKAGWMPIGVNGTYVSATQFTLAGDWTGIIKRWARLELTNSTTKYLIVTSCSHSTGTTTVNVTGGTSYSLASGAITSIFFSHLESPVGWPESFAFSAASVNITGTPATNVFRFSCSPSGRVHWWGTFAGGVTCTNGAVSSGITVPINASRSGPIPQYYGTIGTIVSINSRYYIHGNSTGDISSAATHIHIRTSSSGAGPATGNALEFYVGWVYQAEAV